MSSNEDHFLAPPPKLSAPGYHIASFRPCPECGRRLSTTGKGKFLCMKCGFHDEQAEQVAKIKAAGLGYSGRTPTNNSFLFRGKFGDITDGERTPGTAEEDA
jgi:hypothetical protein